MSSSNRGRKMPKGNPQPKPPKPKPRRKSFCTGKVARFNKTKKKDGQQDDMFMSPQSDSDDCDTSGSVNGACAQVVKVESKMAVTGDVDDRSSDIFEEDEEDRDVFHGGESDEDTEDASETDMAKLEEEYTEMKEQIYQEKLQSYRQQLEQLKQGTHTDYLRRMEMLQKAKDDRLLLAAVCREYEIELIEREYIKEKEDAQQEFENKKIELKETLISELQEKKKTIEAERHNMELTGDSMEIKPATTRKLRRRPNDPLPAPEKRRKTGPEINYLLSDDEVLEDLKALNKLISSETKSSSKVKSGNNNSGASSHNDNSTQYEARIEDGKLFYERKWFHRGQQVYLENKEGIKISGIINSIGNAEIWIKKTDNGKVKVYVSQLQKGKYILRRRSS